MSLTFAIDSIKALKQIQRNTLKLSLVRGLGEFKMCPMAYVPAKFEVAYTNVLKLHSL